MFDLLMTTEVAPRGEECAQKDEQASLKDCEEAAAAGVSPHLIAFMM